MTPKEKSLELFNKIYISKMSSNNFRRSETKLCALIAVNEILNEYWSHNTKRRDWWHEVKQEIEKL